MHFVRALIITGIVSLAPVISSAQENRDALKGFWRKGDATDFKTPVQENSSSAVVYRDYPASVDEAKLRIQKEAAEAIANAEKAQENAQNQPAAAPADKPTAPMTRDQIIAKYGAPNEPRPIRAQKDAPPEMQALFEAINSGDRELAWQYSLALAERNSKIQATVSKVTDYQLLAMEARGLRPSQAGNAETDEVGATRMELKDLMEKTQLEEAQKKLQLDQNVINSLGAQPGDAWSTGKVAAPQAVTPQIPVDPAGKVKVLIFFNEKDAKARELSKSLKPLQEKFHDDPNVSFIGLTMRTYSAPGLKALGANTSFPFPLVNGEALAPELRIQRYPTFVFLAVTSRQTYQLEGRRAPEELEKVLNIMKGAVK